VITRSRDVTGQMREEQQLRGLDETTASRFDEEWRQAAEQHLPRGYGESRQQYLRGSGTQQQQQGMLALPGVEQGHAGGYGGVQQQSGVGQQQQQQYQAGGGYQASGVNRTGYGYGGGSSGRGPYV
jgi:hypothetical protein